MSKIDAETMAIEVSYGDFFMITFKFYLNTDAFFINDTVVFSVKRNLDVNSPPIMVKKTVCDENTSSVVVSLSKDDFVEFSLTPGLYYYDLYMESASLSLIAPSSLTVTEVAHGIA